MVNKSLNEEYVDVQMDIMDGEQIRGRVIVKNLDGPTEGECA